MGVRGDYPGESGSRRDEVLCPCIVHNPPQLNFRMADNTSRLPTTKEEGRNQYSIALPYDEFRLSLLPQGGRNETSECDDCSPSRELMGLFRLLDEFSPVLRRRVGLPCECGAVDRNRSHYTKDDP